MWPHVPFCFCAAAPRLSVLLKLTLHCSFNNCCGTVNICKPQLQLARLCAGLLYVFPAKFLQRWGAEHFDADPLWYESLPLRPPLHSTLLYRGHFMDWTNYLSKQIGKLMSQVGWEGAFRVYAALQSRAHLCSHSFLKVLLPNFKVVEWQHHSRSCDSTLLAVFLFVVLCETKNSQTFGVNSTKKSMFY